MKPWEYIGKDGRTYRWSYDGVRAVIVRDDDQCGWFGISLYDWPAAKAAMDALIEAEQDAEQWVYLESRRDGMHYRIRSDGTDPQWWDDEEWNDERVDADWVECYCKGREVALAEDAELREQVKALVDAVLDADDRPCCRYSSGRTDPWPKDWERITAIARAVQL